MHKYCHTIPKYRHTIPKYCHTIPKFLFRLCNLDEIFLQIVSLIDSEVLASVGETDLSKYNSIKGTKNEQLAADYFSFIEKEIRFIYIKFNLRLLLYHLIYIPEFCLAIVFWIFRINLGFFKNKIEIFWILLRDFSHYEENSVFYFLKFQDFPENSIFIYRAEFWYFSNFR